MIKIFASTFLVVALFSLPASDALADSLGDNFSRVWKEMNNLSEEAREKLMDPDRGHKTAMEFLTFRSPRYVRLLDEAIEILGVTEVGDFIDEINKLKLRDRELDEEDTELRRKKVVAPESSWNPLADTKKSIEKRLAAIPEEKEENRRRVEQLKSLAQEKMSERGVNLGDEEINYFIVSAEGDELVRLMNMAANMKSLQKVMERELRDNPDNINLARIYTGMYLLSLEAWAKAHENALEKIAGYRDGVKKYRDVARKNLDEAKRSVRGSSPDEKIHYERIIAMNEKTMEAADLYSDLLSRRANYLNSNKKAIDRKIKLARGTYGTIENGAAFVSMINSSFDEFRLLAEFEMPELKTIYNGPLLNAFNEISFKIKNEK